MIHFELIFYKVWGLCQGSFFFSSSSSFFFFAYRCPICSSTIVQKSILSPMNCFYIFVRNHLVFFPLDPSDSTLVGKSEHSLLCQRRVALFQLIGEGIYSPSLSHGHYQAGELEYCLLLPGGGWTAPWRCVREVVSIGISLEKDGYWQKGFLSLGHHYPRHRLLGDFCLCLLAVLDWGLLQLSVWDIWEAIIPRNSSPILFILILLIHVTVFSFCILETCLNFILYIFDWTLQC